MFNVKHTLTSTRFIVFDFKYTWLKENGPETFSPSTRYTGLVQSFAVLRM